jgi:ribosomal protein S18 acetylase RimI-like enzyme
MENRLNEVLELIDVKSRIDEPEVQRVLALSMFQPTTPQAIERVVNRCRNSDNRQLWGIKDGVNILGVVEYYIHEDNIIYICNIAVTEQCRGYGIGRFIIDTLQKKYKLTIELETDDDAIGFYLKCGFEVTSFEKYDTQRWKCIRT